VQVAGWLGTAGSVGLLVALGLGTHPVGLPAVAVEVDLVVAPDLGTLGTAGAVGRAAAPDLGMQLVAA
jgi:hypothetical protein